jgi:hypothetical protein
MYTPRSSRPWKRVLKRAPSVVITVGVVLRQLGQQEKAEHAPFAVAAERHAFGVRPRLQALHQRLRGAPRAS